MLLPLFHLSYTVLLFIFLELFEGGPGSGRTTQCELVSLYSGYCHISSGEILRNEVMSGSSRGKALYDYMLNGESVPNDIMAAAIKEEMLSRVMGKGYAVKVILYYLRHLNYFGVY